MRTRAVETALITGGGSGMGRAAAAALTRSGVRVFVADLDLDAALASADAASLEGQKAEALAVDVADSRSVAALFDELKGRAAALDLLIHTAAVMGPTAFIEEVSDDDWRRMMSVTLDGAFFCAREAVRWMKETGGGRIVLFSSVASLRPTPGALPYSAAKGGVNMMVKTLAAEAAKHNIRVNAVAPGYIDTPMLKSLPEGFEAYVLKRTPLKRLGNADEVAALVSFLASPGADFFTGQILSPNGGLVI